MTIAFDLISDLHVDTWPDFDWTYQATSEICVVAGDVARDHELLKKTLTHLGSQYKAVFYIDGNDEHRDGLEHLGKSYAKMKKLIKNIPNVVFMQDHVVVINGVAFVATNCWWSYDYDSRYSIDEAKAGFENHYNITDIASTNVQQAAINDARYLETSISKLQTYSDVKKIVVISHTVPVGDLIKHDRDLTSSYRINTSINSMISWALDSDTEGKTAVWCFGHYHSPVNETIGSVQYVCNPRGRSNTPWHRNPYYPVRIEV
jgi:hypothetical protein